MRQRVVRVTLLAVAAWFVPPAAGEKLRPADPVLDRIAAEAEAFHRLAPRIIGRETLHHKGRQGAPRIRWLAVGKPPEVKYRSAEIVSEYGFGYFNEAPDSLREFRQVVSVDGRLRAADAARDSRQVLAENMTSDDDRLRRRLLEDFERVGQTGSATDFGQMLLLFRRQELARYSFERKKDAPLDEEMCEVVQWRPLPGAEQLHVFTNRRLDRVPMEGEIWLRKSDRLPRRITMRATAQEDGAPVTFEAEIDYAPSRYGLLLPKAVHLEKKARGLMLVDNRSEYGDYQMFDAESAITFEDEALRQ